MLKSNLPALFRNEGFTPVNSLFSKVLKDFFPEDPFFEYGMEVLKNGFPKINLIDEEDKVIIIAEIAGIEKKDIKIQYKDDILSISGEKKEEVKTNKENFIAQELRAGNFCRQIKIDENLIESDQISALYNNGVLKIQIPKKQEKIEKSKGKEIKID